VRSDGRDVRVTGLLQDVVHPVGEPLPVRQLDLLESVFMNEFLPEFYQCM
jgi:hypothetical protein